MTEADSSPSQRADSSAPRPIGASLPADDFKALFRGHPGGVAVITADDGTRPVALTATSVASVNADPPLLLFSISSQSSSAPVISAAKTVVVHLLDADDIDVARLGSTSGVDRFADTSTWSRLVTGEPVYNGVRAWVRCAVVDRTDAAGSTVVIAQALQSSISRDVEAGEHGNALVYHNRTWHRLDEGSRLG
ncbi:flavin reductase family protein [Microbacterium betulae]|uniref:Flavin reductase family protein n=1 Tax=Microbacterium betulae TaxID=2981139 RepID=A0AA97FFG4_9MICO|nr:flavin reductase family protein [Microbacterium sp. AB]WOF21633.1 flavin reductase family protein [Microbacterium sp. AB]